MSLSRKINSIILVAVFGIGTLIGVWEISTNSRMLTAQVDQRHINITNRLSISLADPLWNINYQNVYKVVSSELQDKDLHAVIIYNHNNVDNINAVDFASFKSAGSNENQIQFEVYRSYKYQSESSFEDEKLIDIPALSSLLQTIKSDPKYRSQLGKIIRQNRFVGQVEVVMTNEFTKQRLGYMILGHLVRLSIFLISIAFLLALLLNRRIVKPILELTEETKAISAGSSQNFEEIKSDKDEIKELAIGFDIMRNSINEKITNLNNEIFIRKETEKKLRESENKYTNLFNQIADPVIIVEPRTLIILGHNDATVRVYGYSSKELDQMNLRQLHALEERDQISRIFEKEIVSPQSDYTHVTADGDRIFVELHSSSIEFEGEKAWLTIIRDITFRKKAEAELTQHRDHLEELVKDRTIELVNEIEERQATERSLLRITKAIESASDAIIISEPNSNVFYVNQSFEALFKYSEQEIQESKIQQIFRKPQYFADVFETISTGKEWIGEIEMLDRDKKTIPVLVRANAVKDATGEIIGLIAIFTDMTKRREAEEQLQETQRQLIEKAHLAGMADIASGTLHNVGNLLNSIKTSSRSIHEVLKNSSCEGLNRANQLLTEHSEQLEDFILKDPRGKALLEYYLKVGESINQENQSLLEDNERLLETVDSIVNVIAAQQSYARAAGLTENHRLEAVIESTLSMHQEAIEQNQIQIRTNFTPTPAIPVQKTKLVHILTNLIKNSIDTYAESPGINDKTINISTYLENDHVMVQFCDNGSGIAPENITRIFNMGFTTKPNGHGFGLHSSANYMSEMGADMWAESKGRDQGATFYLKFKLKI